MYNVCFCKIDIDINTLKNHLVNCKSNITSNSNSIEITEVLNQTSPNSSHSNNINTSISSNKNITIDIKAIDEELNLTTSSASKFNTFKINDDIFQFVDGFYFCIRCSMKFDCKKALSNHWLFCSRLRRSKIEVPQSHYCTKCEEYFTRTGFGLHWKIYHGKKLKYLKYKRFTCYKCKIALLMHNEFVHCKQEKNINDNRDQENNKIMKKSN